MVMKDIIIVGAGGHAAELTEYIESGTRKQNFNYNIVGYLDDEKDNYYRYGFKAPYLGSISDHSVNEDINYLMGIANLDFRIKITKMIEDRGGSFCGFIHPTAIIASSALIHPTVVISHNVSVGPKVKIGPHNFLNSRCTIGHDSNLGEFNFISPQVAVAGNTHIGHKNILGTNSCTIPGKSIGNSCLIGAGTTIFFDVADNSTVVGPKPRIIVK